LNLCEVLDTF